MQPSNVKELSQQETTIIVIMPIRTWLLTSHSKIYGYKFIAKAMFPVKQCLKPKDSQHGDQITFYANFPHSST